MQRCFHPLNWHNKVDHIRVSRAWHAPQGWCGESLCHDQWAGVCHCIWVRCQIRCQCLDGSARVPAQPWGMKEDLKKGVLPVYCMVFTASKAVIPDQGHTSPCFKGSDAHLYVAREPRTVLAHVTAWCSRLQRQGQQATLGYR